LARLVVIGPVYEDLDEFRGSGTCTFADGWLRVNPITTNIMNAQTLGRGDGAGFAYFDASTVYYAFDFRVELLPGSGSEEIFRAEDSVEDRKMTVRINSDGTLSAYAADGTTLLATGTTGLSLSTVYRIGVKVGREILGNPAPWEIKINDVSEISGTGTLGAFNGAFRLGKTTNRSSQTIDVYYRNIRVDDADYPVAATVGAMIVTGKGAYNQWQASIGNPWECVDENPHNSDDDYITTSTSGAASTFELKNPARAGITGTILSVSSYAVAREVGTGNNGAFQLRLRSGNTDDDTTSGGMLNTYQSRTKTYETNPATGLAWVKRDLKTVEVGVETNNTQETRCTAICAIVEYIPRSRVSQLINGSLTDGNIVTGLKYVD
jgi:hypothetical protein